MEYLICIKQSGEGCDYTIDCGSVFEVRESESIKILVDEVSEYYGFDGHNRSFEKFLVVPLDESFYSVDVAKLNQELRDKLNGELDEQLEQIEKKEYERLKNKFEAKP